ncbi:MAG: hypothetical protein DHS20C18_47250 [Saprospiraceae bacterium]|nr:MAG: hypothetical protein DHS20C18_47250 [Saprospiraceae bacterium]
MESRAFTQAILAFARQGRANGLNIGTQETLDALSAAGFGIIHKENTFRYALRALFCTSLEEVTLFDQLFDDYWGTKSEGKRAKHKITIRGRITRKKPGSLIMLGKGTEAKETEEEGKKVTGAYAQERLRKTDFSTLTEMESEELEKLAEQLWREMGLRLRRRMRQSNIKGQVNIRRTIRRNITQGGEPIQLVLNDKRPRKWRLVILLDVSGSMDKYSFFLLRFIYALKAHFQHLEAFTFSTRLRRITDVLKPGRLDLTLEALTDKADHWSSGTRIGACLQEFNDQHAKRMLNGQTMVILLSDGLDTGEPELLGKELAIIKARAKRLVWLNPLKGMKGYEPTARGMAAAMPFVDDFSSAHNLNSLLELENLLV